MSALVSHLDAMLAREKATLNEFCRVTGFPPTTITSMRYAASPKQSTLARLQRAIAAWQNGRSAVEKRAPAERVGCHDYYPDGWEKAAAAASDAYLEALGGRRFEDAEPNGSVVDLGARRPALSREPCTRCGVRGDIGCSHQLPMAVAW